MCVCVFAYRPAYMTSSPICYYIGIFYIQCIQSNERAAFIVRPLIGLRLRIWQAKASFFFSQNRSIIYVDPIANAGIVVRRVAMIFVMFCLRKGDLTCGVVHTAVALVKQEKPNNL